MQNSPKEKYVPDDLVKEVLADYQDVLAEITTEKENNAKKVDTLANIQNEKKDKKDKEDNKNKSDNYNEELSKPDMKDGEFQPKVMADIGFRPKRADDSAKNDSADNQNGGSKSKTDNETADQESIDNREIEQKNGSDNSKAEEKSGKRAVPNRDKKSTSVKTEPQKDVTKNAAENKDKNINASAHSQSSKITESVAVADSLKSKEIPKAEFKRNAVKTADTVTTADNTDMKSLKARALQKLRRKNTAAVSAKQNEEQPSAENLAKETENTAEKTLTLQTEASADDNRNQSAVSEGVGIGLKNKQSDKSAVNKSLFNNGNLTAEETTEKKSIDDGSAPPLKNLTAVDSTDALKEKNSQYTQETGNKTSDQSFSEMSEFSTENIEESSFAAVKNDDENKNASEINEPSVDVVSDMPLTETIIVTDTENAAAAEAEMQSKTENPSEDKVNALEDRFDSAAENVAQTDECKIITASGLVANLLMENEMPDGFMTELQNRESGSFCIKYKRQEVNGEIIWQQAEQ